MQSHLEISREHQAYVIQVIIPMDELDGRLPQDMSNNMARRNTIRDTLMDLFNDHITRIDQTARLHRMGREWRGL